MMKRPTGLTLAQIVAEKAALAPSHPAILFDDQTIDYATLRAMAWQRAASLRALGIGEGDRIGILVGNEPEWVALALAAAAVGATLAPLNTWYKPAELAWTIKHCSLRLVIARRHFLKTDYGAVFSTMLRAHDFHHLEHIVMLGEPVDPAMDFAQFLALGVGSDQAEIDQVAAAVNPDGAAYVLYTSGSTAEPKGVLLTHRGVVKNGFDLGQRRGIVAEDRTWLGTPLFYALGATNALPATLTAGATLVLQGAFEAGAAISVIERTRATVYYGTGNMSRSIIDHPQFARERIASMTKGNAGLGSEYKRLTLIEMDIAGAVPAYGLTETYGNAAVGSWDDPLNVKLETDGRALPGQEICIVDPVSGIPRDVGEIGLILIRGHVTPGYLDNAEETAKALRPDGFFDTGDLGSLDEDGRLRFHSRLKDVIKTGGINVSPTEVEQIIVTHPDVRDAHVVGAPDPVRGEIIVAFVDPLRPMEAAAVIAHVREHAASFKAPHHVFFRSEDELPRLATGKIAKARLKDEARELLGQ